MKRSYNEYLLPLLALAGTWLTACSEDGTDPANPYEGNFTLTTQAEVDAFPARREANRITVTAATSPISRRSTCRPSARSSSGIRASER